MAPVVYTLDPRRARVTVRTQAVGLFSPLAHDLEIEALPHAGTARRVDDEWSAEVQTPSAQLRVVGVVRRGRVDPSVLSAHDRGEIERRLRDEVLAPLPTVMVSAHGSGRAGQLTVRGVRGEVTVPLALEALTLGDDEAEVQGRCALSLNALGLEEVRGPLGAFRVHDVVQVAFRAVFVRGG
jgi:hypothetical protein